MIVPWIRTGSEGNPCCCGKCNGVYGDTLNATLAGFVGCAGCYTDGEPGDRSDYTISHTGLSGTYSVTWVGVPTNAWQGVVGSATLLKYSTSDGSCGGDPVESETVDLILTVLCDPVTGTIGTAQIQANFTALGRIVNFYIHATLFEIGDTIDNEITACVAPGDFGIFGAYDGSIELEEVP